MRGGTAVDAAIAALFCNGVVNSQSMGIGGGFLMTVVLANGTKLALVARETAPAAATEDMYAGNKTASTTGNWSITSSTLFFSFLVHII